MKFAPMIAAAVGAQCAAAMYMPGGYGGTPMPTPVQLRVSARDLASKDRILWMKVSESDPFYRLWKCLDHQCHNKQLIAHVSGHSPVKCPT